MGHENDEEGEACEGDLAVLHPELVLQTLRDPRKSRHSKEAQEPHHFDVFEETQAVAVRVRRGDEGAGVVHVRPQNDRVEGERAHEVHKEPPREVVHRDLALFAHDEAVFREACKKFRGMSMRKMTSMTTSSVSMAGETCGSKDIVTGSTNAM